MMTSPRRRAAAIVGLAAVLTVPGGASGRAKAHHARLVVSGGSVALSGGSLKGSVTIANTGNKKSRRTSTTVAAKVAGKPQVFANADVPRVKAGHATTLTIDQPATFPAGRRRLYACVIDDCRTVGQVNVSATPPTPTPTPTPTPSATPSPSATVSASPTPAPLSAPDTTFKADTPFQQDNYWAYVPGTYDRTHHTPIELFIWLHGCGGSSETDINSVANYDSRETFIAITPLGKEDAGQCWDLGAGPGTVLSAIANVASHFNINPRKIVLGGYSSGGDLAYRTAFYNANHFSGILVMNTSPFRDTGSTQQQSLAAASWKFNVVHVAHLQDGTYPYDDYSDGQGRTVAGVKTETTAVSNAGFPLTLVSVAGHHYDPSPDPQDGLPGTYSDIQQLLIPRLDNTWLSPAP